MTYTPSIEPDPREEKLPRWARELLDNMRMRVARAEADAAAAILATRPDESDTLLYRYGSPDVGLGNEVTVQFKLSDQHRAYIQCRIDRAKHYGPHVYLAGGDSIRFEPVSSNAIRIYIRE